MYLLVNTEVGLSKFGLWETVLAREVSSVRRVASSWGIIVRMA
jgi:hypothetical protein